MILLQSSFYVVICFKGNAVILCFFAWERAGFSRQRLFFFGKAAEFIIFFVPLYKAYFIKYRCYLHNSGIYLLWPFSKGKHSIISGRMSHR